MKGLIVLSLAAWSAALHIPDQQSIQEDASNIWNGLVTQGEHLSERIDSWLSQVEAGVREAKARIPDPFATSSNEEPEVEQDDIEEPLEFNGDFRDKTIYELVSASNYTTKFAKILEDHDGVVKLLKDTDHNYTLFVPINSAFEHRRPHGKSDEFSLADGGNHTHKPSKEFIDKALRYHIAKGWYPAGRVFWSHTIATEVSEEHLNGYPQRIRVSSGLTGVRLNFYSRVIKVNIFAKNGIIHAINHVLVPPPSAGKIINLFPSQFSTLSLALDRTGLGEELDDLPHSGGTLFAPSNYAFRRLGVGLNAFLFSERGKPYLKALLKYHVVANETLYSDAFYPSKPYKKGQEDDGGHHGDGGHKGPRKQWHVDLPTLLGDKSLAVDVKRWFGGFISITVNHRSTVALQDAVARDGSIQVVSKVLFPPCHKKKDDGEEPEWEAVTEEMLKMRLQPYVDAEEKKGPSEKKGGASWFGGDL